MTLGLTRIGMLPEVRQILEHNDIDPKRVAHVCIEWDRYKGTSTGITVTMNVQAELSEEEQS